MYKVSEFSAMTGLSRDTLRYYDEIKLLEPARVDPNNGYRYYDNGSYVIAVILVKLRSLGFTIQEMTSVMNDESFANMERLLLEKRERMQSQIDELQAKIRDVDEFLASGREDES